MTNFLDMLFIIQFFIVIGIFIYKLYNIMHKAQIYDLKMSILLFIGFFLSWGIGLLNVMYNTETSIYIQLFKLENWLLILNVLFLLVELFLYMISITPQGVKRYNALELREK